jgi:hypothetical protein
MQASSTIIIKLVSYGNTINRTERKYDIPNDTNNTKYIEYIFPTKILN